MLPNRWPASPCRNIALKTRDGLHSEKRIMWRSVKVDCQRRSNSSRSGRQLAYSVWSGVMTSSACSSARNSASFWMADSSRYTGGIAPVSLSRSGSACPRSASQRS